jgi:diguanylate cyclase (GGDEF)-like protein
MQIEVSDTLATDFGLLIKGRHPEPNLSEHVELLMETELRRSCAPGYETDQLTGCGSRFLLMCDIKNALFGAGWNDRSVFSGRYLCIDIDRLKTINEVHGLPEGERVLVAVANQIRATYPGARAYRTGGDEFVIELNDLSFVPLNLESGVRLKYSIVEARVKRNVNSYQAGAGIMFHTDLGMVDATEEGNIIAFKFPGNI